jgi:hypothetical protein
VDLTEAHVLVLRRNQFDFLPIVSEVHEKSIWYSRECAVGSGMTSGYAMGGAEMRGADCRPSSADP